MKREVKVLDSLLSCRPVMSLLLWKGNEIFFRGNRY